METYYTCQVYLSHKNSRGVRNIDSSKSNIIIEHLHSIYVPMHRLSLIEDSDKDLRSITEIREYITGMIQSCAR